MKREAIAKKVQAIRDAHPSEFRRRRISRQATRNPSTFASSGAASASVVETPTAMVVVGGSW
jgi:hypothetical protein